MYNAKLFFLIVNLDVGTVTIETSTETNLAAFQEGPILEPYVGREFESEEAAKEFYG